MECATRPTRQPRELEVSAAGRLAVAASPPPPRVVSSSAARSVVVGSSCHVPHQQLLTRDGGSMRAIFTRPDQTFHLVIQIGSRWYLCLLSKIYPMVPTDRADHLVIHMHSHYTHYIFSALSCLHAGTRRRPSEVVPPLVKVKPLYGVLSCVHGCGTEGLGRANGQNGNVALSRHERLCQIICEDL